MSMDIETFADIRNITLADTIEVLEDSSAEEFAGAKGEDEE